MVIRDPKHIPWRYTRVSSIICNKKINLCIYTVNVYIFAHVFLYHHYRYQSLID